MAGTGNRFPPFPGVQTFEEWVKLIREWEATPDVNPEPVSIDTIRNGDRFRENGNVYLARSHAMTLGNKVYLSVRKNDWTKAEMNWPKGTIVERVGKKTLPPFPQWKYGQGKDWPE